MKFSQNEERYGEEEEHDGNSLSFDAYSHFGICTLPIWSINLGIVYKLSDLQLPDLKTKNYIINSGYNMYIENFIIYTIILCLSVVEFHELSHRNLLG